MEVALKAAILASGGLQAAAKMGDEYAYIQANSICLSAYAHIEGRDTTLPHLCSYQQTNEGAFFLNPHRMLE